MWITIAMIIILVLGAIVFLNIPFSAAKAEFDKIVDEKAKEATVINEVFTETDLELLPAPLKRYFSYCGYIGTPKMSYMKATLQNVDFVMSETKTIKIDYKQFNLVEKPERFAFISSSLSGIPFEGLDSFENGKGSMKGIIGKVIPLFNQQGKSMDRACLVTWLAECLMVPNAALQDFIKWGAIDDRNARAAIEWMGITAKGVFTFAESGELISFGTSDRVAVDMDGKETICEWSAYFREYHSVNGILQPKIIQSVWHYQNGDCIYFNQNMSHVEFCFL